jgi:hypothetical protein
MNTDNNIKSIQPPGGASNQKLLIAHSILTDIETEASFEEVEVKVTDSTSLRRPQFKINENSRRRFYWFLIQTIKTKYHGKLSRRKPMGLYRKRTQFLKRWMGYIKDELDLENESSSSKERNPLKRKTNLKSGLLVMKWSKSFPVWKINFTNRAVCQM